VTDQNLIDFYNQTCEELSLNDSECRRLWFAISAEVERVKAELPDPEHAVPSEIEAAFVRLGVPPIGALAFRARQPSAARAKRASNRQEPWSDDPREVLTLYWDTVEDLVARSAARFRFDVEEADTVESRVKEKLFKNDCEIVRNFRHESSFRSYLNIIIQRTFANLQTERSGKWHYSAVAERGGPVAKEFERMIHREGFSPSEAVAALLTFHPEVSRAYLETLQGSLPNRRSRTSKIPIEDAEAVLPLVDPDILLITGERFRLGERVADVIGTFLGGLKECDRLLLQLLFESTLKISTIARMLNKDQKALYRRRDQLFAELRRELHRVGIARADAASLYGYIS